MFNLSDSILFSEPEADNLVRYPKGSYTVYCMNPEGLQVQTYPVCLEDSGRIESQATDIHEKPNTFHCE